MSKIFPTTLVSALILLGSMLMRPPEVLACTCNEPPTPIGAFQEATAVFVGTPVSSRDENGSYRYFTFKVEDKLRGAIPNELEIYGGWFTSSCYSGFELGEKYLIYAYGKPGEALSSQYCQRRPEYRFAVGEVEYLRRYVSGMKEPRIYGSVERLDIDRLANSRVVTSLEGIRVVAKVGDKKFETRTDKNGLYKFDSIPDGDYQVTVEASSDFEDRGKSQNGTLGKWRFRPDDARASDYVNFLLQWNNQVSGKVVDSQGNLIRRSTVRIYPSEYKLAEFPKGTFNIVDFLGEREYFIWGIAPGSYYVAAYLRAPLPGKEHFIAYSSIASPTDSARIGPKDDLKMNIRFDELKVKRLEGTVTWPDGTAVSGGNIVLEKTQNSSDTKNYRYDIAFIENGRFVIQAFEGGEYWLKAILNSDGLRAKFPERTDLGYDDINTEHSYLIKVTSQPRPLAITIPFPRPPSAVP